MKKLLLILWLMPVICFGDSVTQANWNLLIYSNLSVNRITLGATNNGHGGMGGGVTMSNWPSGGGGSGKTNLATILTVAGPTNGPGDANGLSITNVGTLSAVNVLATNGNYSGSLTISNQALLTISDARTNFIPVGQSFAGDIGGTVTGRATVMGLQGNPVISGTPTTGDILQYKNSPGPAWYHVGSNAITVALADGLTGGIPVIGATNINLGAYLNTNGWSFGNGATNSFAASGPGLTVSTAGGVTYTLSTNAMALVLTQQLVNVSNTLAAATAIAQANANTGSNLAAFAASLAFTNVTIFTVSNAFTQYWSTNGNVITAYIGTNSAAFAGTNAWKTASSLGLGTNGTANMVIMGSIWTNVALDVDVPVALSNIVLVNDFLLKFEPGGIIYNMTNGSFTATGMLFDNISKTCGVYCLYPNIRGPTTNTFQNKTAVSPATNTCFGLLAYPSKPQRIFILGGSIYGFDSNAIWFADSATAVSPGPGSFPLIIGTVASNCGYSVRCDPYAENVHLVEFSAVRNVNGPVSYAGNFRWQGGYAAGNGGVGLALIGQANGGSVNDGHSEIDNVLLDSNGVYEAEFIGLTYGAKVHGGTWAHGTILSTNSPSVTLIGVNILTEVAGSTTLDGPGSMMDGCTFLNGDATIVHLAANTVARDCFNQDGSRHVATSWISNATATVIYSQDIALKTGTYSGMNVGTATTSGNSLQLNGTTGVTANANGMLFTNGLYESGTVAGGGGGSATTDAVWTNGAPVNSGVSTNNFIWTSTGAASATNFGGIRNDIIIPTNNAGTASTPYTSFAFPGFVSAANPQLNSNSLSIISFSATNTASLSVGEGFALFVVTNGVYTNVSIAATGIGVVNTVVGNVGGTVLPGQSWGITNMSTSGSVPTVASFQFTTFFAGSPGPIGATGPTGAGGSGSVTNSASTNLLNFTTINVLTTTTGTNFYGLDFSANDYTMHFRITNASASAFNLMLAPNLITNTNQFLGIFNSGSISGTGFGGTALGVLVTEAGNDFTIDGYVDMSWTTNQGFTYQSRVNRLQAGALNSLIVYGTANSSGGANVTNLFIVGAQANGLGSNSTILLRKWPKQ